MEYDLIVIGAGPAGYEGAVHAASLGLKTLCIDKEPNPGGTCLHRGCIPSKSLLNSTEHLAFLQKHAKEHGLFLEGLHVDFEVMQKRKQAVVNGLCDGIFTLFKMHGVEFCQGHAKFIDPHTVEVLGKRCTGKNILIATGSYPTPLKDFPFDFKQVVSSTEMLFLEKIPKSLLVIGGGAIGLKMGSIYARLGTEVVVVELLDRIAPLMDHSISKGLEKALKKQGLQIHTKTSVKLEDLKTIPEKILVAIGRTPCTKDLGLEQMGIATDRRGFIIVDQNFKVPNYPHIFAVGDVIEGPLLAHRATKEALAVVDHLAGIQSHVNEFILPNIIYTYPEAASVGFTEEEVKERQIPYFTTISYFKSNPKARCTGEDGGFVKLVFEKEQQRLIGMHILGAHASDLIGEGVVAVQLKMDLSTFKETYHAHPSLVETIGDALK